MTNSLYVAWQYIRFNKIKTATLVACITLIGFLPLVLNRLLSESERQLAARAATTPLVIGAKGSSLDLVMSTLYFGDETPERITMEATQQVADSDLGVPIPLYVRFRARDFPIVGTTLDYFDFRNLEVAQGRQLGLLGECVLGAEAAERLGLGVGDSLVSSPENWFDLAGVYPLKMDVVGVLQRTHTADDLAVFVDLKTAWVIEGLGHGHQDVTRTRDQSVILKRTEGNVAANAKLMHFQEITRENLESFHFHGDTTIYPITAVIAVPYDTKSGTILRGRYLERGGEYQIVVPEEVIDGLLQNIFRIKNVIDAVIVVVGFATVLAIVLVFSLSLRLRQREIETIFKLGCSRLTIARLMAAEVAVILLGSGALCAALLVGVAPFEGELVRTLFIG
jgi:putative ABC transport system permease protein